MKKALLRKPRDSDSIRRATANCIGRCWSATAGDARLAVACSNLQVHHLKFRSQSGSDEEQNLITLCAECHEQVHRKAICCTVRLR